MDPKPTKAKTILGLIGIVFLVFCALLGTLVLKNKQGFINKASGSTRFYISPSTLTTSKNEDVDFAVKTDTGADSITGVDLVLEFDQNSLNIKSIEPGSGIGNFNNIFINDIDNTLGTINFSAFTIDKSLAINGSGLEILRIKANIIANSGNTSVTFNPTSAASATNESSSVLTDTSPLVLTIITPTTAPSASPSPTSAPGEPNSCGGTCGSDNNCKSSYTCYKGYCRNPNCTWSNNCGCTDATSSPKPAATTKTGSYLKTATPTAIAEVIEVTPETPQPTDTVSNFWDNVYKKATAAPANLPSLAPIRLPESKNANILPWIIGTIIAGFVTLVIIIVRVLKNYGIQKNNPPVIKI